MAGMADAIREICDKGSDYYTEACRKRAEALFDKDKCFEKYVELYDGGGKPIRICPESLS